MGYWFPRSRVPRGGVFRRLRRRSFRRASFGDWARRFAGRLAAAFVLAMVLPAFTATLSAQTPTSIGVCMRNNTPDIQSGGSFAPDGDARSITLMPLEPLVQSAMRCAAGFADNTLRPIGMRIWAGLALIITIWTGIQMMFSGGFAIGEVVSLALLLGFPLAIMQSYNTPVPWLGNQTFWQMVAGMGEAVAGDLVREAFMTLRDAVATTWATIWRFDSTKRAVTASNATEFSILNPFRWFGEIFRNVLGTIQLAIVIVVITALLILPVVVAYCSYLWGYLSIMVSIVLGPLLVPWFVVPQLQFLAWGWFRSLVGGTVHLMVAGAVFAVVAQILAIPLVRVGNQIAEERGSVGSLVIDTAMMAAGGTSILRMWWKVSEVLVEALPLIVVAYLGVFKIGEISSMIMNGGSMPASGIGERMQGARQLNQMKGGARAGLAGGRAMAGQAGAAMAGKAAAIATGVGAAVVAAGSVLSQATKRR